MTSRQATLLRKTNETQIDVTIDLDCAPGSATKQVIDVSTGIGFLDHVSPTVPSCATHIYAMVDVYRAGKTWRHVLDHEVQR